MLKELQISAVVSRATKDLLDQHVRATGMKKGRLIEAALRHHLLALQELPVDVIVHPRLVVSRRSGEEILERMNKPSPTKALSDLIAGDGD